MTHRADYEAPSKDAARLREYRKTERYKELKKIESKKWREANREKCRAHRRVHTALSNGKLLRPDTCSNCKRNTVPLAHHEDYNKPLEVIWLCHVCHNKVHHG